jgi:DNA-binding transcriptional ArsR family regulator
MTNMQDLKSSSNEAAAFLKSLGNQHRLTLLYLLVEKERTVSDLVDASGISQSSVSQHLKKLKEEGIVDFTRNHRNLTYRIIDKDAARIFVILHNRFCVPHKE